MLWVFLIINYYCYGTRLRTNVSHFQPSGLPMWYATYKQVLKGKWRMSNHYWQTFESSTFKRFHTQTSHLLFLLWVIFISYSSCLSWTSASKQIHFIEHVVPPALQHPSVMGQRQHLAPRYTDRPQHLPFQVLGVVGVLSRVVSHNCTLCLQIVVKINILNGHSHSSRILKTSGNTSLISLHIDLICGGLLTCFLWGSWGWLMRSRWSGGLHCFNLDAGAGATVF